MKCFLYFFISCVVFAPMQSFAWGLKELGKEAASPVSTDAKYVLYGGTLLTVTLLFFQKPVSEPFQEKQIRNNSLGETSRWGDWMGQLVPNILYVGGMGIASQYGDTKALGRAIGMFKATAYSSIVTTSLKYTIQEPRPDNKNELNSFPSGHATTIFAFSGYVTAEHGYGWGSAALILSAFTAYSRVNDNRHDLEDVMAGATIGLAYGWGISKLQQENRKEEKGAFILPILDSKTAGISLFNEF